MLELSTRKEPFTTRSCIRRASFGEEEEGASFFLKNNETETSSIPSSKLLLPGCNLYQKTPPQWLKALLISIIVATMLVLATVSFTNHQGGHGEVSASGSSPRSDPLSKSAVIRLDHMNDLKWSQIDNFRINQHEDHNAQPSTTRNS